jgi:hypothetical protein
MAEEKDSRKAAAKRAKAAALGIFRLDERREVKEHRGYSTTTNQRASLPSGLDRVSATAIGRTRQHRLTYR